MLRTIKLLLPALFPSWRFFQGVGPSPRIEYTLLKTEQDLPANWQEYQPRPAHVSFKKMLWRMFWNPCWNETLFLVSCAERLIENPTDHSVQEISRRIKSGIKTDHESWFLFRLVFIDREGDALEKHVVFVSPVYDFSEGGDS